MDSGNRRRVSGVTGAAPGAPPRLPSGALQTAWHRVIEVIAGVLAVGIAGLALADPVLGAGLLVFLFAFALLWIGLWRITRGQVRTDRPGWHRTLDSVLGGLSIVLGFVVIALPGLGLLTLVFLLYIALILIGITWIGYATRGTHEPGWYRGLALALGIVSFFGALVALVEPGIAILTLVLIFAFVLLCVGIGDLVSGVTGRAYRLVNPPGWLPKTT
jgi:uncharacterized membrane protein HdeD (DUF308 family)